MKKTLTLVVLAGLMLTGCGGQKTAAPTESTTAVAEVTDTVTVPGVMSLTLDKATDQLEDLGLKVEAEDTVDGKSIIVKKNWQVTSQDSAEGAQVAKGSTVNLGVKSLDKIAAEKAAADKAAAEKAAAEKAAADKAAADKAAADKAAADAAAACGCREGGRRTSGGAAGRPAGTGATGCPAGASGCLLRQLRRSEGRRSSAAVLRAAWLQHQP